MAAACSRVGASAPRPSPERDDDDDDMDFGVVPRLEPPAAPGVEAVAPSSVVDARL